MQRVSDVGTYFQLFAVSAVVMGISHTIAKEKICEPLRAKLGGKDTWLGYLFSCPYCTSHWVALVVVPLTGVYDVRPAFSVPVVTWMLSWIFSAQLVAVIAAFLRVIFYIVDETQGLVKREQKVVEASIPAPAPKRTVVVEERPSTH